MIDLRGITQIYQGPQGPVEALRGIDLHVTPGEVFGIIGRSGAGKSSLVRVINLLNRPSAGQVMVAGRDMTQLSDAELRAARREIGMVFQHFNLLSSRTVYGNIALPLEIAGVPSGQIRPRALDLIARVGLEEQADRYPAELSGGQKQRVAMARALAMDPKVILLDEPTSALDPELVGEVLAVIRDLASGGMTMVMATHQMDFARALATEIVFMEHGKLIEQGSPADLLAEGSNTRTRDFCQRLLEMGA